MSLNADSKHFEKYYDHVLDRKKAKGAISKVYDLINDISDRRGIKSEWHQIDGDIQDEIIERWCGIIDTKQ